MHAEIIAHARHFAEVAHADQVRKYTGEAYVRHTRAVANIVARATKSPIAVAAAHLHDTVEDTVVTLNDVEREFGVSVADLVFWLTDPAGRKGNRSQRKAEDCGRLSRAPALAQTIKLADLIDNTSSIVRHDPNFARVYLAEKEALLVVLTRGDQWLHAVASRMLQAAQQRLLEGDRLAS